MGVLKGTMSFRRYRVRGELPPGFRDRYVEALQAHAFHPPASSTSKEEVEGWVRIQNLLETDFSNLNDWLYGPIAVFALRIDRRTVPARLFRAHLDRRVRAWCEERGRERCPRAVREELADALEREMLARTLPQVRVFEVAWNTLEGEVLFHSHASGPNDRFRRRFHRTFGLELEPDNPLGWLDDPAWIEALAATGASPLTAWEEVDDR